MTTDSNDEWIVSDIGGTHARFNRWSAQSGLSNNPPARYRNDDFRDGSDALDDGARRT